MSAVGQWGFKGSMNKIPLNVFENFLARFDLAFLIIFVFLVNSPLFDSSYLPVHDTKSYLELFYFFYNQLFFHHNLAQWMSFEPFGLAASLKQLHALGPFSYLAMFGGLVLRVQDTLILYKWSIVFEHLILLFGMYKLSRYFFKQRTTTFFVCLALLNGATSWGEQACFYLRVFDMLPITLYTFILFFDRRKIYYLWLTGFLFCIWLMSSSFYPAAIWIFISLAMGAALLWTDRRSWKGAFSPPVGWHWLALSGMLMLAYACLILDFKSGFNLRERGASGILPINNFLVHGGESVPLQYLTANFLNPKVPEYYLGLMPVFFFVWSILRVRDKRYYAVLFTALALFALSFQGVLSVIFYFIPGMFIFHHLAFLYGTMKIFLLVCAGFGLEDFCKCSLNFRIKWIALIILIGVFLADATRLSGSRLYALAIDDATKDHFWSLWLTETNIVSTIAPLFILTIVLVGISWYSRRRQASVPWADQIILTSIFLIVFLNSWQVHSNAHKVFPRVDQAQKAYLYTLNVHATQFQSQRAMVPREGRQKDAYLLASREKSGMPYVSINDFAQFDMCNSSFRADAYSKGFDLLMLKRLEVNKDLVNVLGCGYPKIRLVSQALYFRSWDDASERIGMMPEIFSTVVLNGGDASFASKKIIEGQILNTNHSITVKTFSDDDLVFEINSPTGGWLVYADSYNPAWHATVNGRETPVYQAYLAFKAVWVDAGQHVVRFFYRNMLTLLSSYIIAISGLLAAVVMMILLGRQAVDQALGKERKPPVIS
jgi:hypothetical protein